jgi:hypothetical protein
MGLRKPKKAIEDPPTIVNFVQTNATTIICALQMVEMMEISQCG